MNNLYVCPQMVIIERSPAEFTVITSAEPDTAEIRDEFCEK